MIKTGICYFLVNLSFLFICCNSPSSHNDDKCSEPAIQYSGNHVYIHVFDENGNFINDISGGKVQACAQSVFWDGKDCHGNTVSCGRYPVKFYIIENGSLTTQTGAVLAVGDSTIRKTGRTACDSLKNSCNGAYVEAARFNSFNDPGTAVEDIGCACCK